MTLKSYIKEFLLIESKDQNFYLYFNNETKTFTKFNDLINFVYSNQKDLNKIQIYNNSSEKYEYASDQKDFWEEKFKEKESEDEIKIKLYNKTKTFTNFDNLINFVVLSSFPFPPELTKIQIYNNSSKKYEYASDQKDFWEGKYKKSLKLYKYEIINKILMQKDNRSKNAFKNQKKMLIDANVKVGYIEFNADEFDIKDINELILKKIQKGKLEILNQSTDLSNKQNIMILIFKKDNDSFKMAYVKHTVSENEIKYYASRGGELQIVLKKNRS
tara:strand:+ start:2454 stop:3272 length:819 start_codon:yes stop_codon:yes gene_type:complete